MDRYLRIISLSLFSLYACTQEEPVRLLKNGQSSHRIVLQPGASPSEEHAAVELQTHFEACTGVRLQIVHSAYELAGPMIVLGTGPLARSLRVDPDPEDLGMQGFMLRTKPPHLVIAGAPEAGTLYGVHRFLEEHLGVRWYAPGVTRTPQVSDLSVPASNRLVKPAFFWRDTSYEWPGADEEFFVRVGENHGERGPDSPLGVQFDKGGSAHSYHKFIHPDDYFDEHPEYFSEIGGVRIRDETQLCLTNPEVLEIVTEKMLAKMAEEPGNRQFTFSQKDYYNYCQCERCREINERYQTTGGTQFWFVNQLAERTSQVYPDKLIRTLAYTYTEEPPEGLAIHPNVSVWICHMFPSCDSHPVETCPHNADYRRRAVEWSELAAHLYVWHYATNFTHYYMPFPNLRALAADMKFYRDIGVEGVYLQAMGHSGGGGEFSLLRPYYGMKLLWDPDRDPDELIRDFLQGYYGAAWEQIHQYIDMLHDKVTDDDIHMHLYTNPAQGYLPDDIVEQAERMFNRAESAVSDDPELIERVRVARMPMVYARMFPRNGYRIEDGKLKWLGEIASFEEVEEFIDRMEAHGFKTVREMVGSPDTLLLMYAILAADLDVETIENQHLQVDVVPMLAGRALRIIHKATGKCVTAHNVKPVLYFPFCGGLEDRVGGIFRFYGWVEPATVAEKTAMSITTTADTENGYELRRMLTLEPGQPVLHIESSITNRNDSPDKTHFRNHLELNLGEPASTRVRFESKAGRQVDEDLTRVIKGLREGVHFYAQDAPAGSWTFSGTQGLQLTQRFDGDQIDFTWIYAYPESLGQVEVELWRKTVELQPGESLTLRHDLEIKPVDP